MMAFQASKERKRRLEPVGKGKPLVPSAAIRIWYQSQMMDVTEAMIADYRREIKESLTNDEVRQFFGQDESVAARLKKKIDKLQKKWKSVFEGFAQKTAKDFAEKSDGYASASMFGSLSAAGIKAPITTYNDNVRNTLQATVDFNHTLITGIGEDVHERIYKAVMLSLTSPTPEEQGTAGISNALKEVGHFSKERIKLIAEDQTSKVYSSLTNERMEQNGVDEIEWMHSGAGKVPRESHQDMDGGIFKINDPRFWTAGTITFRKSDGTKGSAKLLKGDLGPPGWAIRCRCRAIPVIGMPIEIDLAA